MLMIDIHIGSVYQIPNVAYTVNGSTLTFTSAPPTGTNNIFVVHKGTQVLIPTPADNSVGAEQIKTESIQIITQQVRVDDGEFNSGTAVIPLDDSIPLITEGKEYISITITPKYNTSKLKIRANLFGAPASAAYVQSALFQDTITNALKAIHTYNGASEGMIISLEHEMISGTTSPITFSVRVGDTVGGTFYYNSNVASRRFGGVANSFIEVTEILQ